MKQSHLAPLVTIVIAALAAHAPAQCQRTETWFASNNVGAPGGQIFYDLDVTNPGGITIRAIGTNASSLPGPLVTMKVFTRSGSFHGHENTASAWTLTSIGSGTAAGVNQPTLIDVADFTLAPGLHGIALVMTAPTGHRYIGTNSIPPQLVYPNADVTILGGAALGTPWIGSPFTPRMWSGSLIYNCASAPTNYCTAGTSSIGCVPTISAASNPSVSHSNACVISIAQVDGRASGLIFYGISQLQAAASTWGASFKCIHAPTQRTEVQDTGGSVGQCDGMLTLDWNAFQTTHSNALGAPWTIGSKVYVQGLYRDALALKRTNLSDAIELTYEP